MFGLLIIASIVVIFFTLVKIDPYNDDVDIRPWVKRLAQGYRIVRNEDCYYVQKLTLTGWKYLDVEGNTCDFVIAHSHEYIIPARDTKRSIMNKATQKIKKFEVIE